MGACQFLCALLLQTLQTEVFLHIVLHAGFRYTNVSSNFTDRQMHTRLIILTQHQFFDSIDVCLRSKRPDLVFFAFCCLVTWFLNHPNSKEYIFVTVASIVMKFAGYGKNRLKFMCTKFGSYNGTIDQDISQSLESTLSWTQRISWNT